jgi:intracellular multiplication protein IcmK
VIFVDETGAPWPIKAYDIGNSRAFNIQWDKESHLMMIQGLVPYSNTNLVVLLHNLETPVILNLINDQNKVDYRLDLRIPGLGPNAKAPIIKSSIPSSDNVLMSLIDGIPPTSAKPLNVKGGAAQVWLLGDKELLIRTRLTILSPSYSASMRSSDGLKVYRMEKTPVIMAAKDGNTFQLNIEGY